MKRIIHKSANLLLIIPFILVLSAVFVVNKALANGVVSGKYFWFYLSIAFISAATPFSFIINRKKIVFSITDLLVFLFCISGLAVTCYHHNTISNKLIHFVLISVLYFYFRIFLAQYRWNVYILTVFFIITGFIEAVWGLKQLYGLSPSYHHLFKTTGSFPNPGPYAGYLAMVMPLAFYYLIHDYRIFKHKFRYSFIPFYVRWSISALSFFVILSVLPAAMSRASWLGATGGCLIAGLFHFMKNRRLKIYIRRFRKRVLFVLLGVIAISVTGLTGLYHLKKDSADGRALIWKTSIGVIKEHPFGAGIGRFSGVYGEKQAGYFASGQGSQQEQYVAGNPEYAFNEYLQICIEFGIIPFILFALIIIYTVYTAFKKKNHAPIGAFISILIFASMSYPFSIFPILIAFVFLIVLSLPDRPSHTQTRAQAQTQIRKQTNRRTPRYIGATALFLLLLLSCSVYCLHKQSPLYDAYRSWDRSRIFYNAGLHKESAKEYGNLYPFLDHEIRFLFEYAQSLSKTERYAESNGVLEKAVKISCDPMLYNIMGKNYQSLGNYTGAEQCFHKAALIVPNRLYPYYLLAKLYDKTGEGEKACEMAEYIQRKEAKIHSQAVNEMREEMKSICDKYKSQ